MVQTPTHFNDYIQIVLRRRWVIVTFFVVLVTTVFIGSLMQTPLYQATTTIMIERRSPNIVSFKEVAPMGESDYFAYRDYYETQYEVITSRSLLEEVAKTLGLEADGFGKGVSPVGELQRIVKANPVRKTQLVEISAEDVNPEFAAKIANEVAKEYINQNLKRNIDAASEAANWLAKNIEDQRQKLKSAELVLQKYREEHNINFLPQLSGDTATEEIKSEYARLQAQLDNYAERYADEHPKMIELKAQISSLRNKIQGLEDVDKGNQTTDYSILEREVQTNKYIYDTLLTRSKEIGLSSTLNFNNISVIDKAQIPTKPIKPKVMLNTLLAVIVGLAGGMSLSFFVDYLDTTIKSPEDIKETLGLNFLGSVPEIYKRKGDLEEDKIAYLYPTSVISEAYKAIRVEITHLASENNNLKSIVISSAEPQAGKTTTVSNLGIALSCAGNKVLLVDGDLRKPQLHKVFGLNREGGLSEYLTEGAKIDSIIKDSKIENLTIITSGKISHNPSEIMGSIKMEEFVRDAKLRFDFILFDSPPIISVVDGVILADKVDASIQVVRSGRAIAPIALRAKEKLEKAKARILGVILNDLKVYYGDYPYYRYYDYYGEEVKEKKIIDDLRSESKRKFNKRHYKELKEQWGFLKSDLNNIALLIKDRINTFRLRTIDRQKDKEQGPRTP